MINYSKNRRVAGGGAGLKDASNLHAFIVMLSLLSLPILYTLTLAQSPVLGDPSEYTFVANMLGIAHPPGYAFITLLGRLFQTIMPLGTIAWRMHFLAAVSASVGSWFVFGIIRTVGKESEWIREARILGTAAGLFGALAVGTAVNHWQHAIHANPHILTATFMAANLYFLTRWWASRNETNTWLFAFCVSAGLGITHHPLTVFGFPAYAVFIFWMRPSILKEWGTLLKMVGLALLGLSVWLYFPIRSPMDPGFGPTTMNTVSGFLDHVLARGLSDSLPYVALADQPNRARVFWSLLRLQFTWPTLFLAIFGLLWPIAASVASRHSNAARKMNRVTRPAIPLVALYFFTFLGIYAFVISLRAQDSMAYLIGPFLIVGLFAGLGFLWLINIGRARFKAGYRLSLPPHRRAFAMVVVLALAFTAGPIWQVWQNLPRVSLRDYDEGQVVIDAVEHWAEAQAAGAVLLSDWERITPLWYERYVNNNWPDSETVTPKLVAAGTENPWLTAVFENLPAGPVYLSNFRPGPLAGTAFRLRPSGIFYQVVEPGNKRVPDGLTTVTAVSPEIEILAYSLPDHHVTAGEFVSFTLAMRSPAGTQDFYVPVLYVGDMRFEFTTDSHLVTPSWRPEEVIVERFDFALPHDLTDGVYPLQLNIKNLSRNEEIPLELSLEPLSISGQEDPPATDSLLANFRQRVGLVSARVWANGRRANAPWSPENGITAQSGDIVNVLLEWEALAIAEESYTIFVHLIDGNNVPYVFLDYTPLGGSAPTHLWIPKWLPGQQFIDPYRLPIPENLPPGTYYIEVGLYEMVSGRRLHISDHEGNLNGDRFILGAIEVRP